MVDNKQQLCSNGNNHSMHMYSDVGITNSISQEIVLVICALFMLVFVATARYYLRNFFINAIVTVVVVFKIAYLWWYCINSHIKLAEFLAFVCSDQNIRFSTPFSKSGESSIPLKITAAVAGLSNVADSLSQSYQFEYRPSPVVEEVQPTTTIIR